jgi:ParB family transcriptional regulator, chromosome partitioning protein
MAKEAERLLEGSGWLPELLRLLEVASVPTEQQGGAGPLPEFLSDDEGRDAVADDDRPHLDCAE